MNVLRFAVNTLRVERRKKENIFRLYLHGQNVVAGFHQTSPFFSVKVWSPQPGHILEGRWLFYWVNKVNSSHIFVNAWNNWTMHGAYVLLTLFIIDQPIKKEGISEARDWTYHRLMWGCNMRVTSRKLAPSVEILTYKADASTQCGNSFLAPSVEIALK